jgi:hypothetical protein
LLLALGGPLHSLVVVIFLVAFFVVIANVIADQHR